MRKSSVVVNEGRSDDYYCSQRISPNGKLWGSTVQPRFVLFETSVLLVFQRLNASGVTSVSL